MIDPRCPKCNGKMICERKMQDGTHHFRCWRCGELQKVKLRDNRPKIDLEAL